MEKRLFFLLDRTHHRLFSDLDRFTRHQHRIPLAQLTGLWALHPDTPVNMVTMGRRMGLKNSAITGLVRRMQSNGLVEQQRSVTDARAFEISMTDQGKEIRERAKPMIKALNDSLTAGFSDEEIQVVLRFLNSVLQRDYLKHLDTDVPH